MFVSPKFQPDDITHQECIREVSRCGQFEGCHTATPYMWNRVMLWGESPDYNAELLIFGEPLEDSAYYEDLPLIFRYDVTLQDIANIPELKGVDYVYMWQDDSGFIHDRIEESNPSPLSISIHYADMQVLNDLQTAIDYTKAIQGIGPKPSENISAATMVEVRDSLLRGVVNYYHKLRSQ